MRVKFFDGPSLQRAVLLLYGERGLDHEAVAPPGRAIEYEYTIEGAATRGLLLESLPGPGGSTAAL